jgi:hypothetical protein
MSVILDITAVICALFIVSVLMRMARAFGVLSPGLGQGALSSVPGWTKRHPVLTTVILLSVLSWIFFPKGCSDEPSGEKSSGNTTGMNTGKEAPVVSPTAEAEPKGTIVGGPKKIVSKVSADRINEWMLQSMEGSEGGWNLMRRQWTGSIDKYGYLPIPVGPVVPGAEVTLSPLKVSGLNVDYKLDSVNQNNDVQVLHLFRESYPGENVVSRDTMALFLVVLPDGIFTTSLKEVMGQKVVSGKYDFSVSISKLPSDVGLWIGSYSTCTAESHQKPGKVPFKVDGENVSWSMRLTIIPSEPVAAGAQELKETISTPGFYDLNHPQVWLMPESAVIDESSPEATKVSLDASCVFSKELTPPFNMRESPTRDSFTISSDEVRRAWQKDPGKEVEWAIVHFKPPADSLVYWEMFFPVAEEDSK